jgi:hypothetical protein
MAPREDALPAPIEIIRVSPRAHPFWRLLRRRGAAVGLAAIVFFVLLALLAPIRRAVRSARHELVGDPQGTLGGALVRHG